MLEFNDISPLWVILCRRPEKGRDEREGQGRKRKMNENEETEEIPLTLED